MAFILINFKIILGIIFGFVLLFCFIVACISVERTKNESIRTRELLENINKITIAYYKRDFVKTDTADSSIKNDASQNSNENQT